MLTKSEKEIVEMKTKQIFALVLAGNLDGAILQTQNVASDLNQIRNREIKEREKKQC